MLSKKVKEHPLKRDYLVALSSPTSVLSDQFRTIRSSIQFVTAKHKQNIFLFTSPSKGEGKSTIIANLAVSMTQQDERVLLIDANMRRPMIHRIFKVPNDHGLTDILLQKKSLLASIYQTGIGNLGILTVGSEADNPGELLGSHIMRNVLKQAAREYDVVLIDSPGILSYTETRVLANQSDGVVLVLNQGKTDRHKTIEAGKALQLAHAHLIGVIMNDR